MENQIDSIEKQIEQIKASIIERYNESIKNIDKDISYAKEAALEKADQNKADLIKELDDRLALIKQFPSVLEADMVSIREIKDLRMEFYGTMSQYIPSISFEGKWKVLILAKRIV